MMLRDYLDIGLLGEEVGLGYVSERSHPDDPDLRIYNYAKKAQAEGRWNDVTRKTRGLIVRWGEAGAEIMARPFEKFFNYGEHPDGTFDLDAEVEISDKVDGSLGVLVGTADGYYIATRGSFTSEQAIKGTEMLQRALKQGFEPLPGVTYLFEIIYPENRIVVDYGDREELVLLDTYLTRDPSQRVGFWNPYFTPTQRLRTTLRELLELPPRPNAEGWVVQFEDGTRVKVKQEDYIRLHRIVTGLNELTVWEWLRDHDGGISGLVATLPEEFESWVTTVADGLREQTAGILSDAGEAVYDAKQVLKGRGIEEGHSPDYRKEFALLVKDHPLSGLAFSIEAGQYERARAAAWKMVRPKNAGQGAKREPA